MRRFSRAKFIVCKLKSFAKKLILPYDDRAICAQVGKDEKVASRHNTEPPEPEESCVQQQFLKAVSQSPSQEEM